VKTLFMYITFKQLLFYFHKFFQDEQFSFSILPFGALTLLAGLGDRKGIRPVKLFG